MNLFQADFSLELGIPIRWASHLCIYSIHAHMEHIDEKASFGFFTSVTRENACVIGVFCFSLFGHRAKVERRVKNRRDQREGGRVIKKRKPEKTLRTTARQCKSTDLTIKLQPNVLQKKRKTRLLQARIIVNSV